VSSYAGDKKEAAVQDSRYSVIYLTGPPATGKSTLVAGLERRVRPLQVYSYSKLLADHIAERDRTAVNQDEIRKQSARMVTAEDVAAVDIQLLATVEQQRTSSHVIIDSHAVTKEVYGFRVTPFSIKQVEALRPTHIIVLYTESSVVLERIKKNSQGRPLISTFEATMHNDLQGAVALIYGIHLGVPIYFLDSNRSFEQLVEEVARHMSE
jgi:adenylate kinase